MMFTLGLAAGFALCWFVKDKLVTLITGAQATAASLEAKAAALRAKI